MHRSLNAAVASAVILMLLAGCGRPASDGEALLSETRNHAAGVSWRIPKDWSVQPERPMRVATYQVSAAEQGEEAAECAVFYFGSDQGGNVEMNIQRWVGQFESEPTPERSTREVNGLQVTEVRIAGTYLAPGGPMMMSQGRKENFRLLGVIVEAPEGSVFFKLTGPAAVVTEAEPALEALVASLEKL